jgi:hypothetical protein
MQTQRSGSLWVLLGLNGPESECSHRLGHVVTGSELLIRPGLRHANHLIESIKIC